MRVIADKNFSCDDANLRLEAQNVMKEIMKTMKCKYYVGILSWFLFHENWHTKEETLWALIICTLESNDTNFQDIDYVSLIEALGYALVDKVPKVRYVAMECIATLCKHAT